MNPPKMPGHRLVEAGFVGRPTIGYVGVELVRHPPRFVAF